MLHFDICPQEKPSPRQAVALQLRRPEDGPHDCAHGASAKASALRPCSPSGGRTQMVLRSPIQGYLPPNVVQIIVRHADQEDMRALHRVSHTWREAVCRHVRSITPASCDPAMLKRFPQAQAIGMGGVTFVEPELASLENLGSLMLHECTFAHCMKALTSLTGLECCRLQDIRCKGSSDMDAFVGGLTNLTSLQLLRTRYPASLPACRSLASLPKLQELVISDAKQQMQMTSLTQLSGLTDMRKLSLSKVGVGLEAVQAMSSLVLLESLELPECCKLTDHAMPSLAQLTELTKLDLRADVLPREEDLSADGIAHLAGLTQMQHLNLAGHRGLTSASLNFLSRFVHLRELNLSGSRLDGGAPFLATLEALQKLDLANTHLTAADCGFMALESMRHVRLRELNLSNTQLDDAAASQIAKLQQLEILDVSYSALTGKGLLEIVDGCHALRVLSVDGCKISMLSMLAAIRARPELRMWEKETSPFPTWVYKAEAILLAHCSPSDRRPRALHAPEESLPATVGMALASLAFFLLYFVALLPIFIIMVVPLGALSILFIAGNVMASALEPLVEGARSVGAGILNLSKKFRARVAAEPSPEPEIADMV